MDDAHDTQLHRIADGIALLISLADDCHETVLAALLSEALDHAHHKLAGDGKN